MAAGFGFNPAVGLTDAIIQKSRRCPQTNARHSSNSTHLNTMTRVLLTGGSGFIAGHVLEYLLKRG